MFPGKKNGFKVSSLSLSIHVLVVSSFLLWADRGLAVDLPGGEHTVRAGDPALAWAISDGAVLNLSPSGETLQILSENSTVNITDGTVTELTGEGITLRDSNGVFNGATISSRDNVGLTLSNLLGGADPGSSAILTASHISGGPAGARVSGDSYLELHDSFLTGLSANSIGLSINGSKVVASGGTIHGGRNGVSMMTDDTGTRTAELSLDGTRVESLGGAAIVIGSAGVLTDAVLDVRNGTRLAGNNGHMVEVASDASVKMDVTNTDLTGDIVLSNRSTLNLKLDDASMVGDVNAAEGATANVELSNRSILTGRLQNVSSLAIDSESTWVMVDDETIGTLSMAGGTVKFGAPGNFYTLNVGNLSGDGTFIMTADFATLNNDFLNVTGTSAGDHKLAISSSGADPLSPDRLLVARTADGGAHFSLVGGVVDVGTYSYGLTNADSGKDWYLDPGTKVISPSTQSVMALFNTAPTVWYGELTSLRSRMGELRFNGAQTGGWVRSYGNKFQVNSRSGSAYDQTQQGLSFGADAPLPVGDGQWLVGVLGGYSQSDLDLKHGTTGTVKSYYVGTYATWLDADTGYYVDGVLKLNNFQNSARVQLSDGTQTRGEYKNFGVGASGEFGKHIELDNNYFIEPAVQVSAVSIQAKKYELDNGLEADGNRTFSLLGKVGVTGGRNFDLGEGRKVQPYARAAFVQAFAKHNDVQVNDNRFNNDLSGSRVELGTGVAMLLTDQWQVHADFDYSQGRKIDQPWGANVGVRYRW